MKIERMSQVLTATLCTTKLGEALVVQYFLVRDHFLFLYDQF
jgi:hypothetical protein